MAALHLSPTVLASREVPSALETVYLDICTLFKEETAVAYGNLVFLCQLKQAVSNEGPL